MSPVRSYRNWPQPTWKNPYSIIRDQVPKPSTIHAAESHLRNKILPNLGKTRLSELGVEAQQLFVNRLSGSSMLKMAQNWGYICEGVSFSKLILPEKTIPRPSIFFTAGQVRAILAEAKGAHRVMLAIAALTGLRIGEILALNVSDFDFSGLRKSEGTNHSSV